MVHSAPLQRLRSTSQGGAQEREAQLQVREAAQRQQQLAMMMAFEGMGGGHGRHPLPPLQGVANRSLMVFEVSSVA